MQHWLKPIGHARGKLPPDWIFTRPEVRFHCGGEAVHMAAGEAWLFDNWRLHRVENPAPHERIHLVQPQRCHHPYFRHPQLLC
jgi:hypothetical protein